MVGSLVRGLAGVQPTKGYVYLIRITYKAYEYVYVFYGGRAGEAVPLYPSFSRPDTAPSGSADILRRAVFSTVAVVRIKEEKNSSSRARRLRFD